MKRVLFDENLPRKLRRDLSDCVVRTVQQEGWGSLDNGALLARAVDGFEVFVTADQRMQYQQTLTEYAIGIIVIHTPRLWYKVLVKAAPALNEAIANVTPHEVIHLKVEWREPL